jgi:uncharacterized protein YegJ (DUF2314 family)
VAKEYPSLKSVDKIPEQTEEAVISVHMQKNVQREFVPPSMKRLQYAGHGITREQALALQKSTTAFILDFAHPKRDVWLALHNANTLVEEIARKTHGLVWDEETRELFSPDAWHKTRIGSWQAGVPDVSSQTVIHSYNDGEYQRAITLGMAKMGLPDVVIQEFPWSAEDQVWNLINSFCQSVAEGKMFNASKQFKLDLQAIKNSSVRDQHTKSLKHNGTGLACLLLKQGKWEEGDPKNRIIELGADFYDGNDPHAKQDHMLSSAFGWQDSIRTIEHENSELMAESERERKKLPELQKLFNQGLEPAEYIQVKAPFRNGNYTEWMWVEITNWKSDNIKGLLENEPFHNPSLHSGQIVQVNQEDIFDYLHYYPDKPKEGNTTEPILEKMYGPSPEEKLPPKPMPNCDDN